MPLSTSLFSCAATVAPLSRAQHHLGGECRRTPTRSKVSFPAKVMAVAALLLSMIETAGSSTAADAISPPGFPGTDGRMWSNRQAFAALNLAGEISAWGSSDYGGSGAPAGGGFVQIFSTGPAFAALNSAGEISAWGSSNNGGSGAPAGGGFIQIFSTGSEYEGAFAALNKAGEISAWGAPALGGSKVDGTRYGVRYTRAPAGGGFVQIFSNEHAFAALNSAGEISAWGDAGYDGSGVTRAPAGGGFVQIFSNEHAFAALNAAGEISAWGYSEYGGSMVDVYYPAAYSQASMRGKLKGSGAPAGGGFVQIFSNAHAFAALNSAGEISAWGSSDYGGSGTPAGGGFVQIFSTSDGFAALNSAGEISTWGSSSTGGLGAPAGGGFVQIFSTKYAFAALNAAGEISAWGDPRYGGSMVDGTDYYGTKYSGAPAGGGFVQIFSNERAFAALNTAGEISAWGDPRFGGSMVEVYHPAADFDISKRGMLKVSGAPAGGGFVQIFSTERAFAALNSAGEISAWGSSDYGGSGAPAGGGYQFSTTLSYDRSNSAWCARDDGDIGVRCGAGQFLVPGFGLSCYAHDTCADCSNNRCTNGQFRTGSCAGTTNGYECANCTNSQCPDGQFRTDSCSGTTDGYKCNACSNSKCPAGQFRTGGCSGTTDGYECATCVGAGVAQADGSCICTGPEAGIGLTCEYTSATTCRGLGAAQRDGTCTGCTDPALGVGPQCQYSSNTTCSGAGVAQADGSCVCAGPDAAPGFGYGPTCSELSNAKSCSSAGVVQPDGSCVCDGPETGIGPTCSELSNAKSCSSAGVVQPDGSCVCDGPETGVGPTCSEYTSATTCRGLGAAQRDGTCTGCTDPALGVGPQCQYSNSTTCSSRGMARYDGGCVCDDGYVGADCSACDSRTHKRPGGGSAGDCLPNAGLVPCGPGQHSVDDQYQSCQKCPIDHYLPGSGLRLEEACIPCGDNQKAEAGSAAASDCFFAFQAVASGSTAASRKFCTGQGSDNRASELTAIQTADECRSFAADPACGPSCSFAEPTTNTVCRDTNPAKCREAAAVCGLGATLDDGLAVDRDCRVICGTCGPQVQAGCVRETATNVVRFFDRAAPEPHIFAANYTPVCSAFLCAEDKFDVTTAAAPGADPVCTPSAEAYCEFEEEESEQSFFFGLIGLGVLAAATGAAHLYAHLNRDAAASAAADPGDFWARRLCGIPRRVHWWVLVGVDIRLGDMVTDWAQYYINLGTPGTENAFYYKYEAEGGGDADAVRLVALTFCALGVPLTLLDLAGARIRALPGIDPQLRAQALTFIMLISIAEDVPQLVLSGIYVHTVGWGCDVGPIFVTAFSIFLSSTSILLNARSMWKMMVDEKLFPKAPAFVTYVPRQVAAWRRRVAAEKIAKKKAAEESAVNQARLAREGEGRAKEEAAAATKRMEQEKQNASNAKAEANAAKAEAERIAANAQAEANAAKAEAKRIAEEKDNQLAQLRRQLAAQKETSVAGRTMRAAPSLQGLGPANGAGVISDQAPEQQAAGSQKIGGGAAAGQGKPKKSKGSPAAAPPANSARDDSDGGGGGHGDGYLAVDGGRGDGWAGGSGTAPRDPTASNEQIGGFGDASDQEA